MSDAVHTSLDRTDAIPERLRRRINERGGGGGGVDGSKGLGQPVEREKGETTSRDARSP